MAAEVGWQKKLPQRGVPITLGPGKWETIETALLTETQRTMEKNQHKVSEKAEGQSDVEWVKGSEEWGIYNLTRGE